MDVHSPKNVLIGIDPYLYNYVHLYLSIYTVYIFEIYYYQLVVSTPLKNISQIGSSSQLLGKIKKKFQTTNQINILYIVIYIIYTLYRKIFLSGHIFEIVIFDGNFYPTLWSFPWYPNDKLTRRSHTSRYINPNLWRLINLYIYIYIQYIYIHIIYIYIYTIYIYTIYIYIYIYTIYIYIYIYIYYASLGK